MKPKMSTKQTEQYRTGASMFIHTTAVTIVEAYQFGRHELAYRVKESKYMIPHNVLTTFSRRRPEMFL